MGTIIRQLGLVLSGILVGGIAVGVYMQLNPVIAIQAVDILGEPTTSVKCDQIKTYFAKTKKKKELGLSKKIQKDEAKHLVSSIRIEADDRNHVVSALFDENSQRVSLFDAPQPLPWLSFRPNRRYSLSYAYGIKTGQGAVGRLSAGYSFIQVKSLKIGLVGQGDTDGDAFGGFSIKYEF